MDLDALLERSTAFQRWDPVTGQTSWHLDVGGKPSGLSFVREYPSTSPCPLCLLGDAQGHVAFDGELDRPLLIDGTYAVVVPNRWPTMGSGGVSELVITRRHVRHLGALDTVEIEELCALLVERVSTAGTARPTAFGLINVGIASGGTQAHLHAQALAGSHTPGRALTAIRAGRGVETDIDLAHALDLVVAADLESVTWVPCAPFASGEVRICGTPEAVPQALRDLARRFDARVGRWSYNVLVHPFSDQVLVQWLPRGNPGLVTNWMCDAVTVTVDPRTLAERLRD